MGSRPPLHADPAIEIVSLKVLLSEGRKPGGMRSRVEHRLGDFGLTYTMCRAE